MKKFIKCILVFTFIFVNIVGCSDVKRYVAYTVYPVGYLLNRIGQGRIETVSIQNNNLVQTATVTNDYKALLEDSTYLFHIGDLEPYFELYNHEIIETGVTKVDLSSLNAIYKFCRYTLVYVDGKESYVESPYYNGEIFKEIDTNALDLSLWIDPIGMLSMAKDVYATLSSNYAEQSKYFKENYDKLEAELIALDAAYQNLSTKLKKENQIIKFVSMTPSFGNWQKAYGFQVYPVCLSKYGAIPSEDEYQLIVNRIKADDVKFIAYEPNMTDQMLQLFDRLESELNLTRVNLYNISSLTPSQINENKDYMSLMYENLSALENMATTIIDNPVDN